MASGADRLREIRMQAEQEDKELQRDLGVSSSSAAANAAPDSPSRPREVSMKGVGTFRIAEGRDPEEERRLLSRRNAALDPPSVAPTALWKLYLTVAVAAGLALFLLWLLFGTGGSGAPRGGSGGDPHGAEFWPVPPLTAAELAAERPQKPCPERAWLPGDCLSGAKWQSGSLLAACRAWQERYGYTDEVLRHCGLLPADEEGMG